MTEAHPERERRLAAIFAADVSGYSRLMGLDEEGTLRALTAHRERMQRMIGRHGGRVANTAGDSVLAEFASAVDAVHCAAETQAALAEANSGIAEERQVVFRIGVHVGDVIVRSGDLFGDGVNIAARLQAFAEPGGICLSAAAYEYSRRALPLPFADLGSHLFKNIDEPLHVYGLRAPAGGGRSADVPARPLPPAAGPAARPDVAAKNLGGYNRDDCQAYIGDFVMLRPDFRNRSTIAAFHLVVDWDDALPGLRIRGLAENRFAKVGQIAMPRGTMYLCIEHNDRGWCSLICLSHLDTDGRMYGAMMALGNHVMNHYMPMVVPVAFLKSADVKPERIGFFDPDTPLHGEYAVHLERAESGGHVVDFMARP